MLEKHNKILYIISTINVLKLKHTQSFMPFFMDKLYDVRQLSNQKFASRHFILCSAISLIHGILSKHSPFIQTAGKAECSLNFVLKNTKIWSYNGDKRASNFSAIVPRPFRNSSRRSNSLTVEAVQALSGNSNSSDGSLNSRHAISQQSFTISDVVNVPTYFRLKYPKKLNQKIL